MNVLSRSRPRILCHGLGLRQVSPQDNDERSRITRTPPLVTSVNACSDLKLFPPPAHKSLGVATDCKWDQSTLQPVPTHGCEEI